MVLTNTNPHPPLPSLRRSIEGSLNARLRAFIVSYERRREFECGRWRL